MGEEEQGIKNKVEGNISDTWSMQSTTDLYVGKCEGKHFMKPRYTSDTCRLVRTF